MMTINFYSYKGGVGRTMLVVQIAYLLAALGKKVVIADFDFDAPGIPAQFGYEHEKVKKGLFELARKFTFSLTPEAERNFKDNLQTLLKDGEYMMEVELHKRKSTTKEGKISLLPCGCMNSDYVEELYTRDWMDFLVAPPEKNKSFLRFFKDFVQDTLEGAGYDYLLIDSRAGMALYGKLARYIAKRQIVIFCPNDEARFSLSSFILADLVKGQQDVQTKLDKLLFLVSRIPPELTKEAEKSYMDMKNLIVNKLDELLKEENILSYVKDFFKEPKILKIHSDLDTQVETNKRSIDKFDFTTDTVQINEDVLAIFEELCSEIIPPGGKDDIWRKIFGEKFEIRRKYRLYDFNIESGEMLNPSDKERNIAFRVETFYNILDEVYTSLEKNSTQANPDLREKECQKQMEEILTNAGIKCGEVFGTAFVNLLKNEEGYAEYSIDYKLERWCKFDADAGFGVMSYTASTNELKVNNLFLNDVIKANARNNRAFFDGYADAIIAKLKNVKPNDPFVKVVN